jgi:hypothetical protein
MATITRQVGDVVARELATAPLKGSPHWQATPPDPARPVPMPAPEPVPEPVEIPDGEPAAAALQLLATVDPAAADLVRARLERVEQDLAELLERTRLRRSDFLGFCREAIPRLRLRPVLEARLAGLTGGPAPQRPDVAAELYALATSIRHFADRNDLRRHWHIRAAQARAELAAVERDLQSAAATVRHVRSSDPNTARHMAGRNTPQDVWVDQVEDLIGRRRSIRARLVALGEDLEARGSAVRAAVEAAGRPAVVAAIAPGMPVPERADDVRARLLAVAAELGRTDPDTRRAAELTAEQGRLESAIGEAAGRTDADRRAAAEDLVDRAGRGDIDGIEDLERRVIGRFPELAHALCEARGNDAQLVATLAEIVADHGRRIEDDAAMRHIMTYRSMPLRRS